MKKKTYFRWIHELYVYESLKTSQIPVNTYCQFLHQFIPSATILEQLTKICGRFGSLHWDSFIWYQMLQRNNNKKKKSHVLKIFDFNV